MSVKALSTQRFPSPRSSALSVRDAVRRPRIRADRRDRFTDIRYRATPARLSVLDVTVALVDPRDAVHTAVQMWCREADPPIGFAGGFATPDAYLKRYRDAIVPDVVVLVLGPDDPPEYERLARITSGGHRLIVYSRLSATETILRCLELGAITYLVKSEGRRHLVEAIRAASTDEPYLGPRMAEALAQQNRSERLRDEEVLECTHPQRIRAKYAAVETTCPVAR